MTELLLGWLAYYGLPVYAGAIFLASAGIPFPVSLMLILTGAFVAAGEMELWPVITLGIVSAIAGDNTGYAIGRFAGRAPVERIVGRFGATENFQRAEELIQKWGGLAVFLSRWLLTFLGRWTNLATGVAAYPWPRFLVWDILGEILWVTLYVTLGWIFSDRVRAVSELAGDISWVIFGLIASGVLGWLLVKNRRRTSQILNPT